MSSGRYVGAKDLRKPHDLIRDIGASGETCFITEEGRAKAVLMDIHRYNALMDLVEEAELPHEHAHEHRHHVSVRRFLEKGSAEKRR